MQLVITLTCPDCGHLQDERMPKRLCIYFHGCRNCGSRLRPKPGDRSIFESYGGEPHPRLHAAE